MSFDENGYELVNSFLSSRQLEIFNSEIREVNLPQSSGGIRNAQKIFHCVEAYTSSDYVLEQAASYLTGIPHFVRAILFNKTPYNNWLVPLHQDKTVAISKQFAEQGWSSKGIAPTRRRVLHFEYSSYELPSGVLWVESE